MVQSLDDVSALAHATEGRFQVARQAPSAWRAFLGQTEAPQLLKTTRAKSLPEMVLVAVGSDDAVGPGLAKERPV